MILGQNFVRSRRCEEVDGRKKETDDQTSNDKALYGDSECDIRIMPYTRVRYIYIEGTIAA